MTGKANTPRNLVINADCVEAMQAFGTGSVDFVLTDPPYVTRFRDRQGRTVANDDNARWLRPAFAQMHRVLKNGGLPDHRKADGGPARAGSEGGRIGQARDPRAPVMGRAPSPTASRKGFRHALDCHEGSSRRLPRTGEDEDGVPARGKPEDGDALPVEFRLYTARGRLLFEGRCGDIAADWWHGMEPLLYAWATFRCRRLTWRPAGTDEPWRPLRP